jgi:hypothetical protein
MTQALPTHVPSGQNFPPHAIGVGVVSWDRDAQVGWAYHFQIGCASTRDAIDSLAGARIDRCCSQRCIPAVDHAHVVVNNAARGAGHLEQSSRVIAGFLDSVAIELARGAALAGVASQRIAGSTRASRTWPEAPARPVLRHAEDIRVAAEAAGAAGTASAIGGTRASTLSSATHTATEAIRVLAAGPGNCPIAADGCVPGAITRSQLREPYRISAIVGKRIRVFGGAVTG